MAQKRFRTNYRLWLLISACIFIVLGFVDPLAGTSWKVDASFWAFVGDHGYSASIGLILFRVLIVALPSAFFGCMVMAIIEWFSNRNSASPRDGSQSTNGIVSP